MALMDACLSRVEMLRALKNCSCLIEKTTTMAPSSAKNIIKGLMSSVSSCFFLPVFSVIGFPFFYAAQ